MENTLEDFWKMVYQQNVACIISLVDLDDVKNVGFIECLTHEETS